MGALAANHELPRVSLRECSDQHLLKEMLQRRSSAAWTEFIRRYRALIYHCIVKVARRYAHELPEAELDEIYAEMLLLLLEDDMRKLRRYNPERGTKLGSWIGLLTINSTHDYLRNASRRPWLERLDPEPESLPERQPKGFPARTSSSSAYPETTTRTPLSEVLTKERFSHLEDILTEFSDKDRMFLHLYYNKGLDAAGVAKRMTISINTVYSKKHKIRDHLHRSVRNQGRTCAIRDLAA